MAVSASRRTQPPRTVSRLPAKIAALQREAYAVRQSDPDRSYALATEARRLAAIARDPAAEAGSLYHRAYAQYVLTRYADALGDARQALLRLEGRDDLAGQARCIKLIGILYSCIGDNRKAQQYFERGLALNRRLGDPAGIVGALNNLGLMRKWLGHGDAALRLFEEGLALGEANGGCAGTGEILTNLGNLHADLGRAEAAFACYRKGLAVARRAKDRLQECQLHNELGDLHRQRRENGPALRELRRALRLSRALGEARIQIVALSNLGEVLTQSGRPGEARPLFDAAIALAGKKSYPRGELLARLGLGRLHARKRSAATAAAAELRKALQLAGVIGDEELAAEIQGVARENERHLGPR